MTRSFVFKPAQGLTAINGDNGPSAVVKNEGDVAVVTGSNIEMMSNPNYAPATPSASPVLALDPKL